MQTFERINFKADQNKIEFYPLSRCIVGLALLAIFSSCTHSGFIILGLRLPDWFGLGRSLLRSFRHSFPLTPLLFFLFDIRSFIFLALTFFNRFSCYFRSFLGLHFDESFSFFSCLCFSSQLCTNGNIRKMLVPKSNFCEQKP